ncbi:sensor histidine kinase [Nocardia farcinica]|uniref:sensor histidine kinase n=1 Tax=Nocardia farcinica TaxID=37329 RepID=UPI002456F3FB|nr:ATP-binding protein [Nocardia farcinica]
MPDIRSAAAHPVVSVVSVVALAVVTAVPQTGLGTALLVTVVAFLVGLGPDGVRRGAAALVLFALLTAAGVAVGAVDWQAGAAGLPSALARAGVPWLIGVALRLRAEVNRQAAARAAQERRQRRARLRQERDAERLALAEALHDDLGHALSLVALTLGRLEVDPTLPAPALAAVGSARRDLSTAVARLGASVVSLRDGTAPGLPRRDDLADLVAQARRAGVHLTGELPPAARLARFDHALLTRVLREALTNATKHAPGQPVRLAVIDDGDEVCLTVRNPVPTRSRAAGSGTGLAALRRHVTAAGGQVDVHDDGAAFGVQVRLPARTGPADGADDETVPGPAEFAADDPADDLDDDTVEARLAAQARRRGRTILAAAAVAVVAALAVVQALTTAQARRALLPAEAFAQIRPGDPRARVEPMLPEHDLPPRPPADPGTDCRDYAVTADMFDDAAGDVYRVCFAGAVVVSTRHIVAGER